MREIFLGKPWHWGLVIAVAGLLWWAGTIKAHVIHFNSFLVALAVVSLAVVLLVLKTHKKGEQVTREPLLPDDAKETEHEQLDAAP